MKNHKDKLQQFVGKNRKILKDTGFVVVSRFLQKALSLLTIFVLVRYFSQESYGEYSFAMGVAAMSSIFSMGGMGNSLVQSVSRGFLGTYRKAIKYTFGGSCVASLILLGFAIAYFSMEHAELAIAFLILATLMPFTHGLSYWKSIFSGEESFVNLSLLMFFMDSLKSILIISLIYFNEPLILIPVFVMFVIPALMNIYFTIKTLRRIPLDAPVEEGSIEYGLKTTLFSCPNVIANKIDATLIYFILSPTSLAIFAIAERVSELVKEGVNDVGLILTPKFSKQKNYTEKLNRILKLFSLVMALGIIIFAFTLLPMLIERLFSEAYAQSVPYAQVLLCSVAIAIFQNMKIRYVMSQLDSDSFRGYIIYTSIARIVFSVSLIPFLGIWGAVASTVFYRIFSILYIERLMRNKYKIVK